MAIIPIEVSAAPAIINRNLDDVFKIKNNHGKDVNAKIMIEDVKGGTAQFSKMENLH